MQKIKTDGIPVHHIKSAEEKIENVSKALYHRMIEWIQRHPLLTVLFSFLISVISNLVSQWLWNYFKF